MYFSMKSLIILLFVVVQIGVGQVARPFFSRSFEPSQQPSTDLRQEMQFPVSDGKKNVGLAATLSLILPGLGEYYVGDYSRGKYFTIAEGALWVTWGAFRSYGTWVRNDARDFAVQHAGITLQNKDNQYFIDIGNYISVDAYNEQALLDRESLTKLYDPNSTESWKWESEEARRQYRSLRVHSDNVFNNADFIIAAVIVNHVLSAIDAGRMAVKHNKALDQAGTLRFQAFPMGTLTDPNGIMLSAQYQF